MSRLPARKMGNYQQSSYPDFLDSSAGNHSSPNFQNGQFSDASERRSGSQYSSRQRVRKDEEFDQRRIQELRKQYQTRKPDQIMKELNEMFFTQDQLIKALLHQNETLKEQNKSLHDENRRLKRRNDELAANALPQSHRGMRNSIPFFSNPVPVENVQPWRTVSCHLLEDPSSHCHWAVNAFVDKVSDHFKSQRINLMVNRLQNITSGFISNDQPLVLPCLNSCRLGTDVKTTYKKYNIGGRKVVLLVFHHQSSHSKFGTASQVLLDADLHTNATLILDVMYQTNEGVYECTQNTDAVSRLASHIQTEQNIQ